MSRPNLRIEKKPDPKSTETKKDTPAKEPKLTDAEAMELIQEEKEAREGKRLDKIIEELDREKKERDAKIPQRAKESAKARKERDAAWRKENPTRSKRTGISPAELLRIDRKARLKAKEEAARRKKRGLPLLKRPGPLKPGEAEA